MAQTFQCCDFTYPTLQFLRLLHASDFYVVNHFHGNQNVRSILHNDSALKMESK